MIDRKWIGAIFVSLSLLVLNGCTTSVIVKSNPTFAKPTSKDYATVYMIRPAPIRTRGVADNDVEVEFGEDQLAVLLSAGEYAAFKINPSDLNIIIRSTTFLTTQPVPVEVFRADSFKITAGKTYLIQAKFIQEEFRGMYFKPVEIDIKTAKEMLNRLKPVGTLAKQRPLENL